jgi:hypothetical protein
MAVLPENSRLKPVSTGFVEKPKIYAETWCYRARPMCAESRQIAFCAPRRRQAPLSGDYFGGVND